MISGEVDFYQEKHLSRKTLFIECHLLINC